MMNNWDAPDWSTIPAPIDDGATDHLRDARLPSVPLQATDGGVVDISTLPGLTVVYAYPRTGQPGVPSPDGWDMIPGARGCTPQSCSFRDHFDDLRRLGVEHLFGLSTQSSEYQREAVDRLGLPFAILSDEHLRLARAMDLPLFEVAGMTLLKRFTLVLEDGVVRQVFYPVFPPDRSASDVMAWLAAPLVARSAPAYRPESSPSSVRRVARPREIQLATVPSATANMIPISRCV